MHSDHKSRVKQCSWDSNPGHLAETPYVEALCDFASANSKTLILVQREQEPTPDHLSSG